MKNRLPDGVRLPDTPENEEKLQVRHEIKRFDAKAFKAKHGEEARIYIKSELCLCCGSPPFFVGFVEILGPEERDEFKISDPRVAACVYRLCADCHGHPARDEMIADCLTR